MKLVKAYDLPLRAFHWLFATLFLFSFVIGKFVDEETKLYAFHMLSGILMTFIVFLRMIWGFIGTKYARFSSFKLKPKLLSIYFINLFSGTKNREVGHNAASSYAAIIMMSFSFFLFLSGLFMVNKIAKDIIEDVHEILAHLFLITVLLHIAGVLFHQVRHKDGIIYSMINGKKALVEGQSPIASNSIWGLVVLIILTISFSITIFLNFDFQSSKLTILGKTLNLGETKNEHSVDYYNNYYDTKVKSK